MKPRFYALLSTKFIMTSKSAPVLIIGGAGIVGAHAVRILRQLHPSLPLAIGGRNLTRTQPLAAEVGNATAVIVDLEREDLGLPAGSSFSAIAIFLKDDRLNVMRYAQRHGVPFVCLSSSTFEIALEVAQFIHGPGRAPIYLASHWLAGATLMPALALAREFEHVDAVHLGVLLDEMDLGGPAAVVDYERIVGNTPATLVRKEGQFTWIKGEDVNARISSVDGVVQDATAYAPLDIVSLGAATNAPNIRLDLAVGESASRRRGEPFSTELQITVEGKLASGAHARARYQIVHPAGQAPLTGLGVALAIERLLDLTRVGPVSPGLYTPEVLIDPKYFVQRMSDFGSQITRHDDAGAK